MIFSRACWTPSPDTSRVIDGLSDLRRDLVDLVDIDDAALRALDIVIGGLQQLQDDVLDVLADIAGLGQGRGVRHRERHVDDPRQGLGQQRLARPGRADQQDVRFGELDIVVLAAVRQPLVVVVHRDRQHPLGVVLADHVIVEHLADVARAGHPVARLDQRRLVLLADDVHAELDAFIADEHGRPGDQLSDLVLALAAERAVERVFRVAAAGFGHRHSVTGWSNARGAVRPRRLRFRDRSAAAPQPGPEPGSCGQPSLRCLKYMCSRRINNQLIIADPFVAPVRVKRAPSRYLNPFAAPPGRAGFRLPRRRCRIPWPRSATGTCRARPRPRWFRAAGRCA